ncbi:MAG: DVUA0089 family protein [Planctomycetes bacterium]|nr:DVUA0089 family protein [Planctomycetota bacterium]
MIVRDCVCGLVLVVGLAQTVAWSAPPEINSLFPAGAQRGTTTNVTIQGKLGGGTNHVWSSQPGISVTFPEKPGPVSISVSAEAEPGVCWLRFYNDEGASGLRPFVIGTCAELTEVEPNDELTKAQALPSLPVVVNGQHGKNGDSDSYTVALRRGEVLVASMLANRTLGSPQDAVLQILGPDGFVLEQNEDDQGFDPQLAFTAPADGVYTLRTWAFPAAPDSSIRLFGSPACVYRLLVTTGPFVDHVLPMAVQAGQSQQVRLQGWNLPAEPIEVTAPLSVHERRFEWILPGWNHRLPATVLVQPQPAIVEVEPNELAKPQVLALPTSVTGQIAQPRDVDTYQFTATKGQRLRFEVLARDLGSPLDPVLRLYDSAGKVLKEADDDGKQSADPDFEFTMPADGDYRIAVTDRFLHHGNRFFYLLTISPPQPDFTLSVAGDAFVLNADKELEIPVTIARTSGFAEEIRVQIQGLPAGVSAEPVVSENKGDSAKSVKLKLKGDGQAAFTGPIQIVGQSSGSILREKWATMTRKEFSLESPYLWLTILPKK